MSKFAPEQNKALVPDQRRELRHPAATRLMSSVRGAWRGGAAMCREPIASCGLPALKATWPSPKVTR
jgi:hypothetical protein